MTTSYPVLTPAPWRLRLPEGTEPSELQRIQQSVDALGDAAQYGWGHTIDFGAFRKNGLLLDSYLNIAGAFDQWEWWPSRLDGMRVADVGCYTGGLSMLMAERGAEVVYAIDEIPENLAQCAFLAETFNLTNVKPVLRSVFRLHEDIEPGSLDLIVLSGVLYHLSDMLVGLNVLRDLLKPGGGGDSDRKQWS